MHLGHLIESVIIKTSCLRLFDSTIKFNGHSLRTHMTFAWILAHFYLDNPILACIKYRLARQTFIVMEQTCIETGLIIVSIRNWVLIFDHRGLI